MMTHNIIIRHLVFPCIPGRGRRPRRPASRRRLRWRPRVRVAPGTSRPTIITWSASCGTFPCIHGRGRRLRRPASRRRLRWRPRVRGAPGTSRPTIITWSSSCGTLCSRVSLITWSASCGTLCSRVSMVGADVPGGPRPDGVSAGVPVCAARRGRRALP